jgi:hypothetical protein
MKVQAAHGQQLRLGTAGDAMRRFAGPEEEPVLRASIVHPFLVHFHRL